MSEPLTILGWPHAPDGSGFYRFYLPFKRLAQFSPHVIAIPSEDMLPWHPVDDIVNDDDIDVVVGQRWMFPRGVEILTEWRKHTHLVYEVDDDILNPDTANALPHLFDDSVRETIKECLGLVHMVTVSTEPLAESLRPYNDNIWVVPNCVDGDMLYIDRPRRERLTVGWSGGGSHLADWAGVASTVGDVLRDRDVDMHFMGIDYGSLLHIEKTQTRYTPWTPATWSFWTSIDFDIGLAPLADTPFNWAKSAIRALEYMALGIPVIASDCPAYRDLVVDGVTGFLVKTEEEWAARLIDLLEDEEMRDEMGKAGREIAAQHVIQRGWRNWAEAYESVAGR